MGQQGKTPSQTENFDQNTWQSNPALAAYMQQMGGGPNNYGGIIRNNAPPPNQPPPTTTPPPTATDVSRTKYGIWETEDGGSSYYRPDLPWGLSVVENDPTGSLQRGSIITGLSNSGSTIDGSHDTGLVWDFNTGQVIGGDAQLDAYRDTWSPTARMFGLPSGPNRKELAAWYGGGTGTGTGPGPMPREDLVAQYYAAEGIPTLPGYSYIGIPEGYTPDYPTWWGAATGTSPFTTREPMSWSPELGSYYPSSGTRNPNPDYLPPGYDTWAMGMSSTPPPAGYTPLPPAGGDGTGSGLVPTGLAPGETWAVPGGGSGPGVGGGFGRGGYGGLGGLGGIEDRMTAASVFGRGRRR